MRICSKLLVLILGLATLVCQSPVTMAAPNSLDPDNCKLPYVNNREDYPPSTTRIGWPLTQERIPGSGIQRILVIPIDFSDSPSSETPESLMSKIVQPERVERFYSFQSNGSLTLQISVLKSVLRMPLKSDEYGFWNQSRDSWALDGPKLESDLNGVLGRFEKDFNYSSVAILVTGGSKAFKSMPASGWALTYRDQDFAFGQPNLKNVMYLNDKDGGSLSDVFIHEFGHLLGFVDLYSSGFLGDSTGPFDVMAYPWEKSKSFLGWNLWLKGWIKDSQVICLNFKSQVDSEIELSSLIGSGKTRLVILRESSSSAIAIEARLGSEYDQLGDSVGLLVYRIRSGAVSPERPVQIIPHKNTVTTKEFSPDFPDTERFRYAPLTQGKYLRERSLIIENREQSKTRVLAVLSWGSSANTRQRLIDNEVNAIAEKQLADRKAKEDAEAKLAKEAQTKSEAEAKLAKEAVAKSEAASKAATEASTALSLELEKVRKELSLLSSQMASLNTSLKAAQSENSSLRKRLATFCKVKPKPKGC